MPQQNDLLQVSNDRTADGAEDDSSAGSESNFNMSADGQDSSQNESDLETEEFAKLRCSSVQTEVISERRRRNPSAGYPGLAFGSSIFSSGTIMKFRVISNELHNIQNVQLKRAEGEVAALQRRIQLLEQDLQKSEKSLRIATEELDIVSQEFDKDHRRTTMVIQQEVIDKYLSLIPEMQQFSITDKTIKTA